MTARHRVLSCVGLALGLIGVTTAPAAAQPLGTFRWQLTPYCNLVTLNVTAQGEVFTLDGFDDQCGAGQRASVVGSAFLNPDGTAGIGFTTVVAPGGTPVHVDARISLSTLAGPWDDSAGNTGTLTFTPGAGAGGPPRLVPPNGIAPGSITAAQLAPGIVGAGQIAPGQVQMRVTGTCPMGWYLRGIHPNGAPLCEPLLAAHATTTIDDPANGVALFTSVAIGANGLPVISHMEHTADLTGAALRVTHCGNAGCTADNVSRTIDDPPSNEVGVFSSLAIGADGFPVISHTDSTAGVLRVTHCGDAGCTAGNLSHTADQLAGSVVGAYTSIAIGVDGLPIISHADITVPRLRVTHCGNLACSAGNISTIVDNAAEGTGRYSSIAIGADGLPVISHQEIATERLRVTHCGNATCTAGNVSTRVDGGNQVGYYSSIAIGVDGLPVIGHYDRTARALRVTHCGNAACTAGNVSTTVDDPADDVGSFASIAIGTDGLPVISYANSTDSALRVAHCGNAACTAGNVLTTVDNPDTTFPGTDTSIAIGADGLPVISYRTLTGSNSALRVTKCATRTCQ